MGGLRERRSQFVWGGAFRPQFSLKIMGRGGGSPLDPQLKGNGRVRQTERTLLAGIIS